MSVRTNVDSREASWLSERWVVHGQDRSTRGAASDGARNSGKEQRCCMANFAYTAAAAAAAVSVTRPAAHRTKHFVS